MELKTVMQNLQSQISATSFISKRWAQAGHLRLRFCFEGKVDTKNMRMQPIGTDTKLLVAKDTYLDVDIHALLAEHMSTS